MVTPGQTLANPITGERFTFTHTAASTGGELLAFELALRPGGAVPLAHVHPVLPRSPLAPMVALDRRRRIAPLASGAAA